MTTCTSECWRVWTLLAATLLPRAFFLASCPAFMLALVMPGQSLAAISSGPPMPAEPVEINVREIISLVLPDGQADPGIVVDDGSGTATQAFIKALAAHRHPERETDPPVV